MIRRFSRAAFLCASLAVFGSPLFAQTRPNLQIPPEERGHAKAIVDQLLKEGRIIRSSSVKRGMTGYALSVFQGTKIEKFPVVVLGNLERVQGGGDIVLIKVLGGPVVQRNSGIIAGMSGSPVYINGKMLGAIALGWGFPKEPIGGVTPITEMIETSLPDPGRARVQPVNNIRSALGQSVLTAPVAYKPSTPLKLAGHQIARVEVSRDAGKLALRGPESGATMTMRPVNTLLQVSGFSAKSLTRLKQMLEPYQISPMIGPSSKKTVPAPPIKPGSAMGVQLVSGDMDQTAIGTVTFRWGNRILGFGHPMFGQGSSSLPLTSAYVHEIFPSYQRSFKLASPIAPAGAVQQDTQFAVGGTLHTKADTVPMSVSIIEAARNINRTYNVQIMKDPMLTPQLIVMVASEAIETKLGITSDKMVRVKMRMDIANAPSVYRTNVLYANDAVTKAALVDLTQTLMLSQMNEFSRGSIQRVDLKVEVEEGRKTAIIKSMTASKNKVKAGETIGINVVLEPTATPDKPVTRTFEFTVPADSPDGVLRLAAAASANFWPLQVRVGGAPPDPTNLQELLAAWNKVGSFNELMVQASTPRAYLQVGDQKVSDPPPAWARLMQGARTTTVGAFNEVEVRRTITPYVLDGAQVLTIPVESAGTDGETSPAPAEADAGATAIPVPGENPAPVLPAIGDDNASDDNSTDQSRRQSAAFTSLPANGRWGALETEKSWDELFAPPALLKPYYKDNAQLDARLMGAPRPDNRQVPPKETGDRPVTGSARNPTATPTPTPTPKPVPTPTPTPTPTPPPFGAGKSVGRPGLSWIQTGVAEFLKGKFDGAFVTNTGEVQAAPKVDQIAQTTEPFVWSIAGDNAGNTYLGTGLSSGNKARILKVDASGKQSTYWEGDGVAVTSLVVEDGFLYAGIAPTGRIMKFYGPNSAIVWGNKDRGDSIHNWLEIPDSSHSFVWALEGQHGKLLAATGGEQGKLFGMGGSYATPAELLISVPQKHIRALSTRGDEIFFGTGEDGVLYRYNEKTKKLDALWQAGDAKTATLGEVLAVAAAPEGVYFGTSLNGTIYRWSESGGVESLYASPQKAVYALERAPDGSIYAATGDNGTVYQIRPGQSATDTRVARVLEPDQRQALALATAGNTLLIGTGNGGAAYKLNLQNTESGTYTSPVFDAKSSVSWGMLRFIGAGAGIETRSGNTAEPDATWSEWQAAKSNEMGELSVASPPARYLQYRARVQSTPVAGAAAPSVSRVEVVYRAGNSAPDIAIGEPKGGAFWMGKKKITWNGKDPDKDTLQYRLFISTDDGKSWQPLGDDASKTATYDWDTTKNPDGAYRLRVVADDALANADDPKSGEAVSLPFIIDNTAPVVDAGLIKVGGNWRLVGTATDATSPISGAEWRFIAKKKTGAESTATANDATPTAATATTAVTATAAATTTPDNATPAAESTPPVVIVTTTTAAKTEAARTEEVWRAVSAGDGIFDSRKEVLGALISVGLVPASTPLAAEATAVGAAASTPVTSLPAAPGTAAEYQLELRVYDAAGNSTTTALDLP